MSLVPFAIAVQGLGYTNLLVAAQGLLPLETEVIISPTVSSSAPVKLPIKWGLLEEDDLLLLVNVLPFCVLEEGE